MRETTAVGRAAAASLLVLLVTLGHGAEGVPWGDPAAVGDGAAGAGVTWDAVRAEIGKHLCVQQRDLDDGTVTLVPGTVYACSMLPPEGALARAVEQAMVKISPALVWVRPDGLEAAGVAGLSVVEAIDRIRAAYLDSPEFLKLLMPLLESEMRAAGLRCEGCPRQERQDMLRTRWEDLAPYVSAYVWPVPVPGDLESGGTLNGWPELSLRICEEVNGIAEMADPDPLLARAAFVGLHHSPPARQLASEYFERILQAEADRSFTGDEARTAYLRERLAEHLGADEALRDSLCSVLMTFSEGLGVVVEECGVAVEPEKPDCADGEVSLSQGCLVTPKRVGRHHGPVIPEKARKTGVGGKVILEILVTVDGAVEDIKLLKSTNPGYGFEEATIAFVRSLRYEPAVLNGEIVEWRMPFVVRFAPPMGTLPTESEFE